MDSMNMKIVEANIKLLDDNKVLEKDNKMLQRRINNAIEFLNQPQFEIDNLPVNLENDIQQLLDILKGNAINE